MATRMATQASERGLNNEAKFRGAAIHHAPPASPPPTPEWLGRYVLRPLKASFYEASFASSSHSKRQLKDAMIK